MSKSKVCFDTSSKRNNILICQLNNLRGESQYGMNLFTSLRFRYSVLNSYIKRPTVFHEQIISSFYNLPHILSDLSSIFFIHGRANLISLLISKLLGVKVTVVVHDYMRFGFRCIPLKDRIKSIYHAITHSISVVLSDSLIFNSSYTQELCLKRYGSLAAKKRNVVIHPLPSFTINTVHETIYGESHRNKHIEMLIITGNSPWKNLEGYKQFFSDVNTMNFKTNLPIIINLVGPSNLNLSLEKTINNNNFTFRYHHDLSSQQLLLLYLKSSWYLSLSIEEGFGIPFLDAMLLGLNILAHPLNSYLEILGQYPKYNEQLICLNSTEELAELFCLNSSKRGIKSEAACSHYLTQYSSIKNNLDKRLDSLLLP